MDVSGDYHPRSRKRSKGVQKSGRSHAIVIREDGDLQSQTKRKSLMSRVRHFLRKFDRQPTFEEQEREVYIRKIKMNDQGVAGRNSLHFGATPRAGRDRPTHPTYLKAHTPPPTST